MAGKDPEFEFLGFKNTAGFISVELLKEEDFYPPGQPNPKAARIADAVSEVLVRTAPAVPLVAEKLK